MVLFYDTSYGWFSDVPYPEEMYTAISSESAWNIGLSLTGRYSHVLEVFFLLFFSGSFIGKQIICSHSDLM